MDSGRRSPKTPDVMQCPTTSYHDTTCVVKFVSGIASKYSETHTICLCLSVEHVA